MKQPEALNWHQNRSEEESEETPNPNHLCQHTKEKERHILVYDQFGSRYKKEI